MGNLREQPSKEPNKNQKPKEGVVFTRRGLLIGGGAAALAAGTLVGPKIKKKMSRIETVEKQSGKLELPQKNLFLDALEKALPKDIRENSRALKERRELLGQALDTFLQMHVENTRMFTSESGAAFPFVALDSADFAKEMYSVASESEPHVDAVGQQDIKSQEFVFGSSLNTTAGTTLTAYEEQLRMLMMRIPEAIAALQRREEPEHHVVYGIGSPVNEAGIVSEEFAKRAQDQGAYDAFAELYGQFVETQMRTGTNEHPPGGIYFWGLSMGGSLAAKTAQYLIQKGSVTQVSRTEARRTLENREAKAEDKEYMQQTLRLPHLSVRADIAPALISSATQFQIAKGFLENGWDDLRNRPYVKEWINKEESLTRGLLGALHKRPGNEVVRHMDTDEEERKNNLIWPGGGMPAAFGKFALSGLGFDISKAARATLVGGLVLGTPVQPGLKITRVGAPKDPYEVAIQQELEAMLKKGEATSKEKLSLQWNMKRTEREGDRLAAANMEGHIHDWLRPTEMRRIMRAVSALASLK